MENKGFTTLLPLLVALLSLSPFSSAYPGFQITIPNGNKVPNPCDSSHTWAGVGHQKPAGGPSDLNDFGKDFEAAGKRWTVDLCKKDSDGDGVTNGQELGDPDCVWSVGATPALTNPRQISHPGICEPPGSSLCQGKDAFLTSICPGIGIGRTTHRHDNTGPIYPLTRPTPMRTIPQTTSRPRVPPQTPPNSDTIYVYIATCQKPVNPPNSRIVSPLPIDGTTYRLNECITYSCNPGYRLVGQPHIFCQYCGAWTPVQFTCQQLTTIHQIPCYNSLACHQRRHSILF